MNNQRLKVLHGVYFLAFLIGLFIRLYYLGKLNMGDAEANNALQAFAISGGISAPNNDFALYSVITSFFFLVFGSSEYLARIFPACVGSLIIIVPYLLRDKLGQNASIIIAFGLALDPGLVAISRQAGGTMLSITFLLIGFGLLIQHKLIFAGISFGLLLLSGDGLWGGVLGIGIALGWTWSIHRFNKEMLCNIFPSFSKSEWNKLGIWALGTYILIGTMFFFVPSGLSAFTQSIVEYLHNWDQIGSPIIIFFIAIISYEIFPFIFGVIGMFRSVIFKNEFDKFLARWYFVALILSIITPGRNMGNFAWSIIPLWFLAGRLLEDWLIRNQIVSKMILAAQGSITLVLILFVWLNISALINPTGTGSEIDKLRILSCIVALVLILIIGLLIGVGWTSNQAISGILSGVIIFIILFSLAANWNAAGLGENPGSEIWRMDSYPEEIDLLINTMSDISEWNFGDKIFQDVIVVGINSPSLRWEFRNHEKVEYTTNTPPKATTAFIITRPGNPVSTPISYRGQDFTGWQIPAWKLLFPVEWIRWVIFRDVPMENDTLILWVRGDLFPGVLQPAINNN
jgi:hypothetical protein